MQIETFVNEVDIILKNMDTPEFKQLIAKIVADVDYNDLGEFSSEIIDRVNKSSDKFKDILFKHNINDEGEVLDNLKKYFHI